MAGGRLAAARQQAREVYQNSLPPLLTLCRTSRSLRAEPPAPAPYPDSTGTLLLRAASLDQGEHGPMMLTVVVSDALEGVEEALDAGPALLLLRPRRVKGIEEVQVAALVVLLGDGWRWLGRQPALVGLDVPGRESRRADGKAEEIEGEETGAEQERERVKYEEGGGGGGGVGKEEE